MSLEFVYDALPGRVVFAAGGRAQLADEVQRLGLRRVLLVAERDHTEEIAAQAREQLGKRCVGWFDRVRVHVPTDLVREGVATARETDADGLVCVGGGSATGMAKAVGLELDLPIVAVPTTYAGSEMTPIWGTTSDEHKRTGVDLKALPRTVIYDPELTRSLPPFISGPSGMNAMAHCVEALYAPGANPVMSALAEEGIRALAEGLPRVVAEPEGMPGREQALYGAYLAGACLAAAGTSIHHKIAHTLGGTWDLPHGPLHAILLPHSVDFVAGAVPDAMARAGRALGAPDAAAVPAALFDLLTDLGTETALVDVGMPSSDLDKAVQAVVDEQPTSPRPVEREPIRALLDAALHGRRPAG